MCGKGSLGGLDFDEYPAFEARSCIKGEDDLVAVGSWEANVTGRWPDFPEA